MKSAFKIATGWLSKKVVLLVGGLVGVAGFFYGLIFLVILILVIGAFASTNDTSNSGDDCISGEVVEGQISPSVMQWKDDLQRELDDVGAGEYTMTLLAIMQQETGGNADISDPMQASESYCGSVGCIKDQKLSIHAGAIHFKDVLDRSKSLGVDSNTMIQSYNMGIGFVGYVSERGGKWTEELAKKFSDQQTKKNPSLYNCATSGKNGQPAERYPYCYGDYTYVNKVVNNLEPVSCEGGLSASGDDVDYVGGFITPTKGTITSGYGPRWGRPHNGVDWGVPTGTPVYDSATGVVSKVHSGCVQGNHSCGGGWGNHIFVDHTVDGKKYTTIYAHLSSAKVKVGTQVNGGQVIAGSGHTGHSTGPHLHFEIRLGHSGTSGFNVAEDPMKYVK